MRVVTLLRKWKFPLLWTLLAIVMVFARFIRVRPLLNFKWHSPRVCLHQAKCYSIKTTEVLLNCTKQKSGTFLKVWHV